MVDLNKLQIYCHRLKGIEDKDQTLENLILKLGSLGSIMEGFERNYTLSELEERAREEVNSDSSFPYYELKECLENSGEYSVLKNLLPLCMIFAGNDELDNEQREIVEERVGQMEVGSELLNIAGKIEEKRGNYRIKEFSRDIKELVRKFEKVDF